MNTLFSGILDSLIDEIVFIIVRRSVKNQESKFDTVFLPAALMNGLIQNFCNCLRSIAAAVCNALIYTAADMLDPKNRGWN